MDSNNSIEVKGLGKRVADAGGTLSILEGIDFTVEAGSAVAITGSSGSGKSTLLGLLAGLDVPSTGSVRLAGQDLFALDEDGRARLRANHVGFVFQSFQLLPNLTALENVMLPLELAGQPAREAAQAMLEQVGLGERLHHYPRTLSGGEQQRVSLARAFVVNRICCSPMNPPAAWTRPLAKVIDLMFDLHREHGATLVLVTHDPQLAARCGRQLVLAAGRMA